MQNITPGDTRRTAHWLLRHYNTLFTMRMQQAARCGITHAINYQQKAIFDASRSFFHILILLSNRDDSRDDISACTSLSVDLHLCVGVSFYRKLQEIG